MIRLTYEINAYNICVKCGNVVESGREYPNYQNPTCYSCLPLPTELPINKLGCDGRSFLVDGLPYWMCMYKYLHRGYIGITNDMCPICKKRTSGKEASIRMRVKRDIQVEPDSTWVELDIKEV